MKIGPKILNILFISTMMVSCSTSSRVNLDEIELADANATDEVKLLYHRIQQIADKGIAFGHQDATAYGIGWEHLPGSSELRSDIKEVTGKFPAVHGFDVGHIELGNPRNLDSIPFSLMKNHILKMHEKGAVITMSWHLNNPVSNNGSWDTTPTVSAILKGGAEREKYELWVKRLSNFLLSLRDSENNIVPVVFRPFHEMNGSWFWWGADHCTPSEYKQLWRETLELFFQNDVHSLLYVYSPNTLGSEEEFYNYYPGDGYVDILGVDIYNHSGNEEFTRKLKSNLEILNKKAKKSNKPYVLAESGNVNFGSDKNWWTQSLYPGIKNSGIAWALFWRNDRPEHYFSTYKGEISEEDFKEFESIDEILFLPETQNITPQ